MAAIDDVASHLDSNSTKVTAGTSLFKHSMAESTGRSVHVISTPGLPPIEKMSAGKPAMTRPRFQIVTRTSKAVGGSGVPGTTATYNLACDMRDILGSIANTTVGGVQYQRIHALQSDPFNIGRDDAGRVLFGQNFECLRSPTTQA